MKRLTALLLTLLFTLSACTAALAWSCPSCGTEGNGNFCTECGTKRPDETVCPSCGTNFGESKPNFCTECGTRLTEAAPATLPAAASAPETKYLATSDSGVNIVSIEPAGNGYITVTWEDLNSKAPYETRFIANTTGNFQTDRANNLIRLEAQDLTATSYTYQYLVPGMSYWLVITNAEGNGVYISYDTPVSGSFTDFTITASRQPLLRAASGSAISDLEVSAFSAAAIAMNVSEPGLYLRMDYPALDAYREYAAQLVITDPNGVALVADAGMIPFEVYKSGAYRYWEFFSLDWYFDVLDHLYDTVPTGEHTLTLYLDGKWAAETTFTVEE